MFIESILNTQNPNELYRLWSSIKYKRARTPISTDIRLRYTRYITVKNSSTSISRPNIPLIQPPSSAFKNTYNKKYRANLSLSRDLSTSPKFPPTTVVPPTWNTTHRVSKISPAVVPALSIFGAIPVLVWRHSHCRGVADARN